MQDRDVALLHDVNEVLRADRRVEGVDVAAAVRGGVVHLEGAVAGEAERRELRRVVAGVRGVRAVWDLVSAGDGDLTIADVGAGGVKQKPEAVAVDVHLHKGVDVVADLNTGLPFPDDSLDHVFLVHVLEHTHDVVAVMNELHRAIREGGVLHILVPHWRDEIAVADPTHLHFFCLSTFSYFCRDHPRVRLFTPVCAAETRDTVYADLEPVKGATPAASAEDLARFFG